MKTKLLIVLTIALLCIPFVLAESKLEITDINVRVDGSKESGIDANGGTVDDVEPESELKVEVTVKNTYSSDDDMEIMDIRVEGILERIDDGDDLDEEADDFDLDETDSEDVELVFNLPLQIEEGSYDLEITVEGEDENNTDHNDTATLRIRVEKENHKLVIYRTVVNPNNVACGRSTYLELDIYNLGTNEEDDVELIIQNADLGLYTGNNFTLSDDIDDDDNLYSKKFDIAIPEDASVGSYPISIAITYDRGDEDDEKLADLVVSECNPVVDNTQTTTTDTTTTDTQTTTTDTTDTTTTTTVTDTQTPAVTYDKATSFKRTGGFFTPTTMLIGLVYLIVIAALIIIVVKIVKK